MLFKILFLINGIEAHRSIINCNIEYDTSIGFDVTTKYYIGYDMKLSLPFTTTNSRMNDTRHIVV